MQQTPRYRPIPYSFTLNDIYDKPLILGEKLRGNVVAHCPPFHILLDHTIAVVWLLFSYRKFPPLRSAQVSWALRFLEGMINEASGYSEDVGKAIKVLQNCLADLVAADAPRYSIEPE